MVTGKQKASLRKLAQQRRSLFQMGKNAISENFIKTISDALEAHELVKISLLKTCVMATNEAAIEVSIATHSEIIQVIGRTFVLYRVTKKNKRGL